jgi:oligopeptidase A
MALSTPEELADNPLLQKQELPPFSRIRPEHAEPAVRKLLERARSWMSAVADTSPPTFEAVVEPLEEISHELSRVASLIGHLNRVLNSNEMLKAHSRCLELVTAYQTDRLQNAALYRAYSSILERGYATLSRVQRKLLESALRDCRLAGVSLKVTEKKCFRSISLQLSRLQATFEQNILDSSNSWSRHITDEALLRGLSPTLREGARRRAAEQDLSGWVLDLDQATYTAVLTDAESASLRFELYEAWNTRASDRGPSAGRWDNARIMEQILCKRHEAARLLGKANYAEYALATRMAQSVEDIDEFLRKLLPQVRGVAAQELERLEGFAAQKLQPWDVTYYAEQLKRKRYELSDELRKYFPLPNVLNGLFDLTDRLFGLQVRERKGVRAWHPDVRFFEFVTVQGEFVGGFYLDAYSRPHKRGGAWMDECVGRKRLISGMTQPLAYLTCNFLSPTGQDPCLLTQNDIVTLFHEFGHCLQHILTQIDYPSVAGLNGVPLDAVELPSQLMEHYAWQPEILGRISSHCQTGAPLSSKTQVGLLAGRGVDTALRTLSKLELSLFDLRLHARYSPKLGGRVRETLEEVRREVSIVAAPEWDRFANSFRHIFSGRYAAGCYSYVWADVLAADAFSVFEERGLTDRATAQRFLESILSQGGARDALEAFVEFRGRAPEFSSLVRHLNEAAGANVAPSNDPCWRNVPGMR